MANGKCPKCDNIVTYLKGHPTDIRAGGSAYNGVQYQCPYCTAILGAEVDPLAIKSDILNGVKKILGR